jgi:hypothetical protein
VTIVPNFDDLRKPRPMTALAGGRHDDPVDVQRVRRIGRAHERLLALRAVLIGDDDPTPPGGIAMRVA